MTCPRCQSPMKSLERVECRTGDAQKHRCMKCGAICFEQLTGGYDAPPALTESFRHIKALATVCTP